MSNRTIKTDGELNIESTNVNIDSTTDITGDINAVNSTLSGNISAVDGTFTGDVSITGSLNNFNLPSADGTAGQIIQTDGSFNLSFVDAASGGGADVDTIANASDAANYSGTAKFINITSTADVTFTNDFSNRIINIVNNITVTFIVDSLENCIIKGKQAEVIIENPYQPDIDTVGNNTIIYNCDIRAYTVRFLAGGYSLNPGSSHAATSIYFYNSTIYSRYGSTTTSTFDVNFSSITNFMGWTGTPTVFFYNSLFSNHNGIILASIRVYLSEARIYLGKTDSSLSAYGLSGAFYETGGPILIVVSRTDASFTNAYSMSTSTNTSQHFFG